MNEFVGEQISSPLTVFNQALKRISNIFLDIQEYMELSSRQMIGNYYLLTIFKLGNSDNLLVLLIKKSYIYVKT